MNKWLEILIGLILLIDILTIFITNFRGFAKNSLVFLQGGIIWFIILMGILFIFLGLTHSKKS
jgi:hypothetical protein